MTDTADIGREDIEAFNRRDWDRSRELYDTAYFCRSGDGRYLEGPEAGIAEGQAWTSSFPDAQLELESRAATRSPSWDSLLEAHTSKLMGIPPTGMRMELPVGWFSKCATGR